MYYCFQNNRLGAASQPVLSEPAVERLWVFTAAPQNDLCQPYLGSNSTYKVFHDAKVPIPLLLVTDLRVNFWLPSGEFKYLAFAYVPAWAAAPLAADVFQKDATPYSCIHL